ncbi:sodium leak channel non-selective protein [Trichonephila clavata]|uniref:Sodium leak channel non-selective protein n=1 Tax=Trichonephila clavata TaxID=2740835 RepID=A0A8X6HUF8_TRICU|nr:sodium leak channel non-selective protein [Trichonephila clavata]
MLGRKQSMKGDEVLADYGAGETLTQLGISGDMEWLWVRRLLRLCALLSLVSVSLNTTRTFERYEYLFYATFVCDIIVTILFTIEMIVKMTIRGFLMGDYSYLKDRWCQFDATMVFFLWISVILQIFEMLQVVPKFSYLSILRAPRPLIMIRFIRVFLKFSMPKSRINQIFKRSSQQIYNVTLFFLFFMSLYGLLGVQFFGEMSNHCVVNGTDPNNVTLDDLAIPDTYCSNIPDAGYHCPEGMVCMELELPKSISGFNGFDDFAHSFFTVYQAASQEGWALLMYKAMDSLPAWRAICYFTTLIFFLAWLVKNVFIAVITETFNEIRVQFQQGWGERGTIQTQSTAQVLKGDDSGWKLITVDENKGRGKAPHCLQVFLQSAVFQVIVMVVNVANAIVAASIKFEHDGRLREEFYKHYYLAEVGFTIFFDLEVLFKIWCLGFHGYYRRSLHKFELLLAIGTTLHIIPDLYMRELSSFQVLRIVRLIKASPVLEDFVYKIFGPGKKLGSLIIFTMCLLVITSSISMQLFCSLGDFNKFEAFPEAFMSMFQILTQEGWGEVMNETMLRTSRTIGPLVAIYFILYHLFVTLIVLSLFVAVILDNLELDEDIKKVKQLKAREQSAGIKEGLPLRLLLFERFPDSPQMSRLNKVPSEFIVPKVRESFMRQFVDDQPEESPTMKKLSENEDNLVTFRKTRPLKLMASPCKVRNTTNILRKASVTNIVIDSNNQRLLVGDSGQIPVLGKGPKQTQSQKTIRLDRRSMRRSMRGSIKIKQTYDHLRENGDGGTLNPTASRSPHDFDIKLLQQKRQQAEMKRNQREEDLRENHPYFDTPLFMVARESRFRKFCQTIVWARYDPHIRDPVTGKERKIKYKTFHNLLGLVTYLDWFMIWITTLCCISMMFETPQKRVMNTALLQVAEYIFVTAMSLEIILKTLADGLFFTPKALIKDAAGVMDFFIFAWSCMKLWP